MARFDGPRVCDARLRFDRELIRRCDTPLNSLKWDYVSRYCDPRRKEEFVQISVFVRRQGVLGASPRITEGVEFIGQRVSLPDRAGRVLWNNCTRDFR